jgi:hypothetical protein
MKLEFAPWIEQPDPVEPMTAEQIERMARGAKRLLATRGEFVILPGGRVVFEGFKREGGLSE